MGAERAGTSVRQQAPGLVPPLLPDPLRRPAVAVIACCAALVAAGAVAAAGRSDGNGLDRAVDSWIVRRLAGHAHLLALITDAGNAGPLVVMTLVLVLACLLFHRVNGAILTVASVVVASALTELVLKPIVHETIGHPAVLSYPSGHTTNAFTLSVLVVVLLLAPPPGRPLRGARLVLAILAVLGGCAVAVSLIAIHYHYFTDTVAGACVATGVVLGLALLLDAPRVRSALGRISRR
jgi:membrane-associated phospholipid phosphatase